MVDNPSESADELVIDTTLGDTVIAMPTLTPEEVEVRVAQSDREMELVRQLLKDAARESGIIVGND